MVDIVERLQILTEHRASAPATTREAAEEIERLRAELERRDRFEWDCPKCGIHVTSQVIGR